MADESIEVTNVQDIEQDVQDTHGVIACCVNDCNSGMSGPNIVSAAHSAGWAWVVGLGWICRHCRVSHKGDYAFWASLHHRVTGVDDITTMLWAGSMPIRLCAGESDAESEASEPRESLRQLMFAMNPLEEG